MKNVILGTLYQLDDERRILQNSKVGLQNQANSFQWEVIFGFDFILKNPVDIFNVLPVGTYPKQYSKVLLKSRKWSHTLGANDKEIGSINLPILKQITRMISCKKELKKWVKENRCENELYVIIYSTYLPFLRAVNSLGKQVKITLIVTDIPEYDDLTKTRNPIKKFLRVLNNKLIYSSLNRIDNFVLITEQMKNILKVGERPYVIVEGLADIKNIDANKHNLSDQILDTKAILYTGTLHYQFGIKNLLEAFELITYNNYELWICGSGEAEDEIKRISSVNKRVKFFGFLVKEEVKKLQRQATILINPRPNIGEYTKYSFPSKTMEYLVSGKPVIMYKLDGIPDEYDNYLYYIGGDKPKDMALKIIEVCETSEKERDAIGILASNFVIEKKNNIVQAKKILNMMNNSVEEDIAGCVNFNSK